MSHEEPATFGALLRRYRLRAGWTQETLAERAGISARAISDLERGLSRAPNRDTRDRLLAARGLAAEERRDVERVAQRVPRRPRVSTPLVPPAPPGSAETRSDNLPVPLTSFVGREDE